MAGHIHDDVLVNLDDYPDWARSWLLVLANKNFLVAAGVMFIIFLPNLIWGGGTTNRRKAAVGKDS